jgi:hypothetical protein
VTDLTRTRAEALRLLHTLCRTTDGGLQQWRTLESLGFADQPAAVQHAVDEGWLMINGGHSVCMTEAGLRLVD